MYVCVEYLYTVEAVLKNRTNQYVNITAVKHPGINTTGLVPSPLSAPRAGSTVY